MFEIVFFYAFLFTMLFCGLVLASSVKQGAWLNKKRRQISQWLDD
jgi:hypothetical protein